MKSKRAQEYLEEHREFHDGLGYVVGEGDANVIGLIAEEEMVDKALEAFKAVCECNIDGEC